ncbi:hypothetical protein L1887_44344 [Cichorium endivia]|nr:hypothetical protein L1887_44344 [Cichorium endivia]
MFLRPFTPSAIGSAWAGFGTPVFSARAKPKRELVFRYPIVTRECDESSIHCSLLRCSAPFRGNKCRFLQPQPLMATLGEPLPFGNPENVEMVEKPENDK